MSQRPSRRSSQTPPEDHAHQRRLEFARMLMGAIDRGKGGAAGPSRVRSVRPPTPTRPASHRPKAVLQPIGAKGGGRVLVIDDDQAIRDMVGQVLATQNEVYQASDGKSALELLEQIGAVDVIVCDVMMPRLDGFGFARAAKADPALSSTPILFLTARGSAMDQVEGIQAGARSYLTKPFKVKELLVAVKRAMRR